METPEHSTPEQQQDLFILSFLDWLDANFKKIGDNEYLDAVAQPQKIPMVWKTAEILDMFRKQQIPSLPELSPTLSQRSLRVTEEAMRRNRAMFTGFLKIRALLSEEGNIKKQAIDDIIIDAISHMS